MFHHQSLFVCLFVCCCFWGGLVSDALVLLTDLLRLLKIFFPNFSLLFALSWDIFYRPFMCLVLGQYCICLMNSVTDVQFFCCLPNILSVISFQSYSFPTDHFFCKLVDGVILCHVQHLPFCPKLQTQHKNPFQYCMYCASGRKCIQL